VEREIVEILRGCIQYYEFYIHVLNKGSMRVQSPLDMILFDKLSSVISCLEILFTFHHAGPWIKSRAGFDKPAPACSKPGAYRNSLDSGFRRNDGVVNDYKMSNA